MMFRATLLRRIQLQISRLLTHPINPTTSGEQRIAEILKQTFPNASVIEVYDISGGCGAMYEVIVETNEFKNINRVQQHRLVNEALKEEIKDMHGLRIITNTPKSE